MSVALAYYPVRAVTSVLTVVSKVDSLHYCSRSVFGNDYFVEGYFKLRILFENIC